MSDAVPVVDELFTVSGGDVALLASRCDGCGGHFFPQTDLCPDPACPGGELERVALGRRGRLYSWTRQEYRPPALFAMDPWAPYVLAVIELPEGLRVLAMLTGDTEDLRCDAEMELVAEPLRVAADGREVLTYKYRRAAAP